MTDDQLFGEVDLETENRELRRENKRLNAFLVERGLATDYWKWKAMFDE